MKTKHTATPYKLSNLNAWLEIRNIKGYTVCRIEIPIEGVTEEIQANAEFICTAVNNHENLLEALIQTRIDVENMALGHIKDKHVIQYTIDRLNKAIAKAEWKG